LHGIDLSVIPPDIREIILGKIWGLFQNQIIKNTNPDKVKTPLPLTLQNLENILRKTGYKNSIFGFRYSYFSNLKEIKSEDWVRIPSLELNSFEGLNSFEIYKEYKSKLK
jgi:hypothetical protein